MILMMIIQYDYDDELLRYWIDDDFEAIDDALEEFIIWRFTSATCCSYHCHEWMIKECSRHYEESSNYIVVRQVMRQAIISSHDTNSW